MGAFPKGKWQFSGLVQANQKHWQSSLQCWLQNRSFSRQQRSMPGKHEYCSEDFWVQAMWPIGREGGGGIVQRRRSLISMIDCLV